MTSTESSARHPAAHGPHSRITRNRAVLRAALASLALVLLGCDSSADPADETSTTGGTDSTSISPSASPSAPDVQVSDIPLDGTRRAPIRWELPTTDDEAQRAVIDTVRSYLALSISAQYAADGEQYLDMLPAVAEPFAVSQAERDYERAADPGHRGITRIRLDQPGIENVRACVVTEGAWPLNLPLERADDSPTGWKVERTEDIGREYQDFEQACRDSSDTGRN